MSRLFYAVNRETGERWKPSSKIDRYYGGPRKQYLMMYDSGYFAVVSDYGYAGRSISDLCTKTWKIVFNDSMTNKIVKSRMDK